MYDVTEFDVEILAIKRQTLFLLVSLTTLIIGRPSCVYKIH